MPFVVRLSDALKRFLRRVRDLLEPYHVPEPRPGVLRQIRYHLRVKLRRFRNRLRRKD